MTELEKKAYAYATDRQKDPNYPTYNWETEITDAYEQGYKDAVEKASLYVYHLSAHPNVAIDGKELEKHFKEYMEE